MAMQGKGGHVIDDFFGLFTHGFYFCLDWEELYFGLGEFVLDVGTLGELFAIDHLEVAELEEREM